MIFEKPNCHTNYILKLQVKENNLISNTPQIHVFIKHTHQTLLILLMISEDDDFYQIISEDDDSYQIIREDDDSYLMISEDDDSYLIISEDDDSYLMISEDDDSYLMITGGDVT